MGTKENGHIKVVILLETSVPVYTDSCKTIQSVTYTSNCSIKICSGSWNDALINTVSVWNWNQRFLVWKGLYIIECVNARALSFGLESELE